MHSQLELPFRRLFLALILYFSFSLFPLPFLLSIACCLLIFVSIILRLLFKRLAMRVKFRIEKREWVSVYESEGMLLVLPESEAHTVLLSLILQFAHLKAPLKVAVKSAEHVSNILSFLPIDTYFSSRPIRCSFACIHLILWCTQHMSTGRWWDWETVRRESSSSPASHQWYHIPASRSLSRLLLMWSSSDRPFS